MRISYSGIKGFLHCRRAWHYEHVLHLEPRLEKPAFFLGHGVHDALEHWYQGDTADPLDWFNEWAAAEILRLRQRAPVAMGEMLDLTTLAHSMLEGYMEHYGLTDPAKPDNTGVRLLAKELNFEVAIPHTDDGRLIGRVDGVCVDENGSYWIFETKTYTQAPSNHDMNLQTLAYVWAANQPDFRQFLEPLGIPAGSRILGSLYNGLRKQAPGPRVTRPLFMREWVLRTDEELHIFGESVLPEIYAEMNQSRLRIYPTLSKECQWCDFRDPCQARLNGSDEQWLLDTFYMRKSAHTEEKHGDSVNGLVQ